MDPQVFRPLGKAALDHLPRPVQLDAGRLAPEKNLAAFLQLELPGNKVLGGDGPARAYSAADVFVFPSRTDTFGLVMLEVLACGVPVAAFPVRGPLDVLGDTPAGALDEDLAAACRRALEIPAADCVAHARNWSWQAVGDAFLAQLAWIGERELAA